MKKTTIDFNLNAFKSIPVDKLNNAIKYILWYYQNLKIHTTKDDNVLNFIIKLS